MKTATAEQIRAEFQRDYTEQLEARLKQEDIVSVGDGYIIEGWLLDSIDLAAASAVRQSFRNPGAVVEALEIPDCYEGIDYQKIIQKVITSTCESPEGERK
nr:hypothetical protein [uncultured Rhodopila sp.]